MISLSKFSISIYIYLSFTEFSVLTIIFYIWYYEINLLPFKAAAPQLHQTILPPSTHDKIFWCCGAFFFSRDLQPGNRFAILYTHLDNRISRPDWIQRHDSAEMWVSLTTPLQNRGRNLIRGERRTITDTSVHIHTPMPGFENLYPLLNLNFQNLRKK